MAVRVRTVSLVLILALLVSAVAPTPVPKRAEGFGLLTIGAVILVGWLVKKGLDDSVDNASDESKEVVDETGRTAKQVIEEASAQLSKLLEQLESTYGNALDTTIDSLDSFMARQLSSLYTFFTQINQVLMADVGVITKSLLDLVGQVNQTIQQTLAGLEDLVVVAVRGATFVIDKTTYNIAFLIAILLLALGLLFFIWLLWSKRVPGGWVRVVALCFMGLYLVLFSALLVPQTRVYAITMTGQAQQLQAIGGGPRIITVYPDQVTQGTAADLLLIGANFGTGDKQPKVILAGQEVTPTAWSDNQIAVHLTGALAGLSGQQSIAVRTGDGQSSTPAILTFVKPPQPVEILSWRLVPSGQGWEYKEFGPFTTACKPNWVGLGDFGGELKVAEGWELAADSAHVGTVALLPGSMPNPPLGFSEKVSAEGPMTGELHRDIAYLSAPGNGAKLGITVRGSCTAFSTWRLEYRLWGKRPASGVTGTPATGGRCAVQGVVKCGTYPAEQLSVFKDGRPDSYSLWVTVRTAAGETVDQTASFRPGLVQPITVGNLSLWMENNDLMAKGPGGKSSGIRLPSDLRKILPKGLPLFKP